MHFDIAVGLWLLQHRQMRRIAQPDSTLGPGNVARKFVGDGWSEVSILLSPYHEDRLPELVHRRHNFHGQTIACGIELPSQESAQALPA